MTMAQVVKISVTNNNLSEDYSHPGNHRRQITDTPGFKPFAKFLLQSTTLHSKYACPESTAVLSIGSILTIM